VSGVPPNVHVTREAPGRYGVRVTYSSRSLVGMLLGPIKGYAGEVRRDRATGRWAVGEGLAEHRSRDAAVLALLASKGGR